MTCGVDLGAGRRAVQAAGEVSDSGTRGHEGSHKTLPPFCPCALFVAAIHEAAALQAPFVGMSRRDDLMWTVHEHPVVSMQCGLRL